MGQIITLSSPKIINGALGIVLVGESLNPLSQKYFLIQDHDDRGRGDGILKYGLPGGGIETDKEETPLAALKRELNEEGALDLDKSSIIEEFGCFSKLRPNGSTNKNYLFIVRLNYIPNCVTNDPNEVSETHIKTLGQIIYLASTNWFNEGSIRLIFHFLNGSRSGSLNEPISFNGFIF